MKILIISTSVAPLGAKRYGGIELLVSRYLNALNKRSHEVTVAAPIGSKVPDGVELIETVALPEEQDKDDIAFGRYLRQSPAFDVIHDFSHKHVMARNITSQKNPIVSMIWSPVTYRYEVAPFNIVAISEWQGSRFRELHEQAARVMPSVLVDCNEYTLKTEKSDRFLFIGKATPEKGAHKAIEYAKALNVPLDLFLGLIPSDIEANKRYVSLIESQCDGMIKTYYNTYEDGAATQEKKIELLQNARALIYPVQQDEAHSQIMVEAMACGTPFITFARGVLPELDFAGALCHSEEGFLQAMKDETEYPVAFPEECREVALKHYDINTKITEWETLYGQVADGLRWF